MNTDKRQWRLRITFCSMLFVASLSFSVAACGGGIMPYIPTGTGAGTNGTSSAGQFFLIDKGVTSSMLDVRGLQPVLRNIVTKGNERNLKNLKQDSAGTAPHHLICPTDSASVTNAEPVLNLHKLH